MIIKRLPATRWFHVVVSKFLRLAFLLHEDSWHSLLAEQSGREGGGGRGDGGRRKGGRGR